MTEDRFIDYDGAYVLGALSPIEREEFEAHLEQCDECRQRVAELAGLPSLLALVPESAYVAPIVADPVVTLLATARARKLRRRWITAAVATAAAACLIAATALISHNSSQPVRAAVPAIPSASMSALASGVPIHATVALTDVAWGTSIRLRCTYDPAVSYPPDERYSLVVRSRSGQVENLGTWALVGGKVTTFPAGTALHKSDIESISIDSADGAPLLQLTY